MPGGTPQISPVSKQGYPLTPMRQSGYDTKTRLSCHGNKKSAKLTLFQASKYRRETA